MKIETSFDIGDKVYVIMPTVVDRHRDTVIIPGLVECIRISDCGVEYGITCRKYPGQIEFFQVDDLYTRLQDAETEMERRMI